jgi:hypothetical protein
MAWMAASIRWIMPVSGALTCTMIYAVVAPYVGRQHRHPLR